MLVLAIALDESDQFFVAVKGKDLLIVKYILFFHFYRIVIKKLLNPNVTVCIQVHFAMAYEKPVATILLGWVRPMMLPSVAPVKTTGSLDG